MKYTIKIPSPCNEKWSEMTPTERGAFCSNCKKEVYDFTSTSNYQLAVLLDQNEKLCGRFRPKQLNANIPTTQSSKTSQVSLFVGLSTFLALSTPIFSQNKLSENRKTEQLNKINQDLHVTERANDSILIKGLVTDSQYPLPVANVYLKDAPYEVQTDFDGNFSLAISKEMMDKNPVLIVPYLGFETQEIRINKNTGFLNVELKASDYLMGEVVIVKHHIFRRIGNLFKKKNKDNCD